MKNVKRGLVVLVIGATSVFGVTPVASAAQVSTSASVTQGTIYVWVHNRQPDQLPRSCSFKGGYLVHGSVSAYYDRYGNLWFKGKCAVPASTPA